MLFGNRNIQEEPKLNVGRVPKSRCDRDHDCERHHSRPRRKLDPTGVATAATDDTKWHLEARFGVDPIGRRNTTLTSDQSSGNRERAVAKNQLRGGERLSD
ncbi:hypothetical protein EVAR_19551_1 [Eumeta japonica]|uniref:Uncharacterized protein n=1 Tax=Eumeta variegata TaxID=151549 RepID=A0A4C1UF58_EUMVA|nr:hypothetical protein EVAR_19551_1 [Eumeta japonica]